MRGVYRVVWVDEELYGALLREVQRRAQSRGRIRGLQSEVVNEALRRYVERHGADGLLSLPKRRPPRARVPLRVTISESVYNLLLSHARYGLLAALVEEALREYLQSSVAYGSQLPTT